MQESVKTYFRLLAEDRVHGPASAVFYPLLEVSSWVYGGVSGLLRIAYEKGICKRHKLPFPVISVGNLTWGGSGKTPFVEYLARKISEQHKTPLILSRGYSHDEIEQMKHHLPHVLVGVGRNRTEIAHKISKEKKIDLVILDDGLQHWPLERDLEIIVVNALNPFGNGKIIPRGILREPLSQLKRAHLVVLSHVNLVSGESLKQLREKIQALAPQAEIVESYLDPLFFYRADRRKRVSLDQLENERVATFSGVGTPMSFQLLLSKKQIRPVRNFEFTDHHCYSEAELLEIKRVRDSAEIHEIITTEKDFYRCPGPITKVLNPLILAARLRVGNGEEALFAKLRPYFGDRIQ